MKKTSKVLFAIIMLFVGIKCIMAEDLTNVNVNFKHQIDLTDSYEDLYIEITADNFSNNEYRVLFTRDNSDISNVYSNPDDLIYMLMESIDSIGENPSYGQVLDLKYIAQYGNVYITLYEYDGSNYNKVSDSILVKRQLLQYTNRIVTQFYDDDSIDIKIKDIYSEDSTVKIKLGEVTDVNLLAKLDGTDNSAYAELITYAKNDTDSILNKTVLLSSSQQGDKLGQYPDVWNSTKVLKDKYYYGYFVIDDENGKYYPLEDVQLYKLEEGNFFACNFKTEGPIDTETSTVGSASVKSDDVDVPNTASTYSIILVISGVLLAVSGLIIFIGTKKKMNEV